MLMATARPVQLLGRWGFIISWLYRGIGINFEMAFLPYEGTKCACYAQFPCRVWKFCHFAYSHHPISVFHSTKYQHTEEGSVDLRPLHYVNL